jgi:hypothetical protein
MRVRSSRNPILAASISRRSRHVLEPRCRDRGLIASPECWRDRLTYRARPDFVEFHGIPASLHFQVAHPSGTTCWIFCPASQDRRGAAHCRRQRMAANGHPGPHVLFYARPHRGGPSRSLWEWHGLCKPGRHWPWGRLLRPTPATLPPTPCLRSWPETVVQRVAYAPTWAQWPTIPVGSCEWPQAARPPNRVSTFASE